MMSIDRRTFLTGLAAAGTLTLLPSWVLAQDVNVDDLQAPGPLGEMVMGSGNAPVTMVEYASFTCPHCGYFHNTILPEFKLKYIDSGKVRLVFRSLLRNGVDVAISAIARCAPADKYFDVVDAYFTKQEEWSRASDLKKAIFEVAQEFDFTEESFDACLDNKALLRAFDAEMSRAESFGVESTPTFFINGQKQVGALPMNEWDALIEPLLAEAGQ